METQLLNVGDKVIQMHYGKPYRVHEITRVTKTQAFYKIREDYEGKLYREYDRDWIKIVGGSSFSGSSYHPYNKEYQDKFERSLLEGKVKKAMEIFPINKASNEKLNSILELLRIDN